MRHMIVMGMIWQTRYRYKSAILLLDDIHITGNLVPTFMSAHVCRHRPSRMTMIASGKTVKYHTHTKSCQVFTGWMLILQVASKMPQRGLLVDEDGALDVDDLAAMTRFKCEVFQIAIEALVDPKVRWLEWVEIPEKLVCSGRGKDEIQINQDTIPARQDESGQNRTEGNRTEQKGTVFLEPDKPPPKKKAVKTQKRAESFEELAEYLKTKGLPKSDAEWLWNKWEANGWKRSIGNREVPIESWKHTACQWDKMGLFPSQKQKAAKRVEYVKPPTPDTGPQRPKKLDLPEPKHDWNNLLPEHIRGRSWSYWCSNEPVSAKLMSEGIRPYTDGPVDFQNIIKSTV